MKEGRVPRSHSSSKKGRKALERRLSPGAVTGEARNYFALFRPLSGRWVRNLTSQARSTRPTRRLPDHALRPGSWSYGTRHVRWARGAVIADEGSDGRPRLIQTDSPLAA